MFGLIVKLIEFGLDKWSGAKIQQASSDVERERILADVEKNKDQVRGMILSKGSYWFQLFFIVPLAVWFACVVLYSIFWCNNCMYPQGWTIAALPRPLDEWAGWIIGFLFLAYTGRK